MNSSISVAIQHSDTVILFGEINGMRLSLLDKSNNLKIFWGIAGWSKTQLLGEIARGGWGVHKPILLDNMKSNFIWNHFIENSKVIFSGENDYSKMFKTDDI